MFGKTEKKKSSAPLFITIGALAVIGVASITRKGKKMIDSVCAKLSKSESME